MNILPKKRWHVRTKENIARVRKDEAEAAEKEKESQRKILLAEKEARTTLLREKARQRFSDGTHEDDEKKPSSSSDGHVNFFEDVEKGIKDYGVNLEHEKEKKEEKEKYEKNIGYLTYLGQNTVEATGEISWYNKVPERFSRPDEDEKSAKIQRKKELSDPLKDMCKYLEMKEGKTCSKSVNSSAVAVPLVSTQKRRHSDEEDHTPCVSKKARRQSREKEKSCKRKKKRRHGKNKKKRSKRHRKDVSTSEEEGSSDSVDSQEERKANIERLRQERLKREAVEAEKARAVVAKARGEPIEEDKGKKVDSDLLFPSQKYNSQFNPHLARQNFSKADPFSVQST